MDTRDNTDNSQKLIEATPNPKPRKQSKRSVSFAPESPIRPSLQHSASPTKASQKRASLSPTKRSFLIQSPHAANPHADYIPPSPSHAREQISTRRRSITPIPPYEPPSERFTPPREVLCTPVNLTSPKISKSSKRKSAINSHGKTKKLVLQIKKELPDDIDLNAPPPPPSPTDDPLLLTGPPGSRKKRQSQLRQSHVTHSRETPPLASSSPIRGEDLQHTQLLDLTLGAAGMDLTSDDFNSTLNTFVAPLPIFDFASTNEDDAWTDDPSSDEEGASPFDGTGEFTGKFKMRTVPTKVDPPSSSTKQRMDAWGHPVSPFPDGERRRSQGGEEGNEDVVETSGKQVTSEVLQDEDVFGRPETPQIVEGSSTVARKFPSASESLAPSEEAVTVQVESVVTTLSPVPESEVEEPTVGVQPTYRKSTPPSGPFDFGALGDQSFEVSYEAPQEPTEEEVAPVQDNSMEVQMEQHPVQDRQVHFVGVESGTSSDAMSTVEEPSEPHHEPEEEVSALSEVHRSPSPAVGQHVNIARVPRSPTPARVLDTSVDEVCFEEPSILEEDSSLKDDSGYLEAPETIPAVKSSETAAPVSAPETPTRRSATATQPTGVPRTPAPQIPVVESDDEEEDDEVVVFRELSQPPEVDSDEEPEKNDDLLARSFARVTLMSPSNPFQPATPGPALSTPVTHPASNSFEQTRREWRQHSSGVDGAGSSTVQARYIFTSDHPVVAEDEGVEEDGSEDEELDEKVIKITSDDPRAAARAAAILRLVRICLPSTINELVLTT